MAPPSLRDAFRPLTRSGGYYARSWRDYIVDDSPQLPVARPTVALAVEALRDEVVLLGLRARRPVSDVAVVQSGLIGGCDRAAGSDGIARDRRSVTPRDDHRNLG